MAFLLTPTDCVGDFLGVPTTSTPLPVDRWPLHGQTIGMELELENLPEGTHDFFSSSRHWRTVSDGSLRGNSVEIITRRPSWGSELTGALDELATGVEELDLTVQRCGSFRTSTHVHLGFTSRDTVYTVPNGPEVGDNLHGALVTAVLYYLLEDVFFEVAGNYRASSGYCFRIDAAPDPFYEVMATASARSISTAPRYYGLNLNSLAKHGTLEFRHLPLVTDAAEIAKWVRAIMRTKLWAYKHMRQDMVGRAGYNFIDIIENPSYIKEEVAGYVFQEYGDKLHALDMDVVARRCTKLGVVLSSVPVRAQAPVPRPRIADHVVTIDSLLDTEL